MNRRESIKLISAVPFALAGTESLAAATAWSRAAEMPLATQEIYPTRYNGELIVAGGIGGKIGVPYFTDRCVAYCPDTNTWREHSTLPEPRHHAALTVADSRLFLLGGFNGSYTQVWRMRSSVLEYTNGAWKHTIDIPQPQAEGVVATSAAGLIHVVTGQSPKASANSKRSDHREIHKHWCWNPGETIWRELAPIPTARNSASGGWLGDNLIVAGGRTASGNMNAVEIYQATTDSWREGRPMPLPQAGTASVIVDDGLIVFGGEIFQPDAKVFKEVWRYSFSSDTWHALPSMPVPRHGLGAVKFNEKVYVVGGATRPSGSGTSKIAEVLNLDLL